jgi:hypothetical protein
MNCGTCGNDCTVNGETCTNGACVCKFPKICGGTNCGCGGICCGSLCC